MYKGKKILAIIPARKGSKRIPNKNIKSLLGKPLIYYTIRVALENSGIIDKIIVSTNSNKIAEISKKLGVDVPFLRPEKISGDKVSDEPVIKHCINYLLKSNEKFDYVSYLRPTAPFRIKNDILEAIKKLEKNKLPLVRSVTRVTGVNHPYWMYKSDRNLLFPFVDGLDIESYYQSGMLPKNIYSLNGMVDVFTVEHALKGKFIYKSDRMGFLEIPQDRAIDIDEQIDFDLVEFLMKKGYYKKIHD